MRLGLASITLASAFAVACSGGDDDDSSTPTTVNSAGVTNAVTGMTNFSSSLESANGADAALYAFQIGAAAQSIVVADNGSTAPALIVPPRAAVTGTCDCDADSCMFEDCGDEAGTWTIDGSIEVDGDHVTFDLDLAVAFGGQSLDWQYQGDLTVNETLIDGSASGDGSGSFSAEGENVELDWSWELGCNEITLNDNGCPTGGSLDASVSYDVSGSSGEGSFSGSASVAFGPDCGDFEIE
jgi:autotransporter translocation and assembly factor TamB